MSAKLRRTADNVAAHLPPDESRAVALLLRLWAWLSGEDARTVRHVTAWAGMEHVELSIRGRMVARGSGKTDLDALEDALGRVRT
jgi:hypothetical protein